MPMRFWLMKGWWRPFTRHWQNGAPRVAAAAAAPPRPRLSCACWFSSTPATGAMRCWSAAGSRRNCHLRHVGCPHRERAISWGAPVCANLVYRNLSRVGGEKMPDQKTMGHWGRALGAQVIENIHERMVAIAKEKEVVAGRKMRTDTTVVETNIHHPTDSGVPIALPPCRNKQFFRGQSRQSDGVPPPACSATACGCSPAP
jgi:hypothetical protein